MVAKNFLLKRCRNVVDDDDDDDDDKSQLLPQHRFEKDGSEYWYYISTI